MRYSRHVNSRLCMSLHLEEHWLTNFLAHCWQNSWVESSLLVVFQYKPRTCFQVFLYFLGYRGNMAAGDGALSGRETHSHSYSHSIIQSIYWLDILIVVHWSTDIDYQQIMWHWVIPVTDNDVLCLIHFCTCYMCCPPPGCSFRGEIMMKITFLTLLTCPCGGFMQYNTHHLCVMALFIQMTSLIQKGIGYQNFHIVAFIVL